MQQPSNPYAIKPQNPLKLPKQSPLGKIKLSGPEERRFGGLPRLALPPNWMPKATRILARNLNRNLVTGLVKTL